MYTDVFPVRGLLFIYFKNSGGGLYQRMHRLMVYAAKNNYSVHYISPGKPSLSNGIIHHSLPDFPIWHPLLYLYSPLLILYVVIWHNIRTVILFDFIYSALCLPAKMCNLSLVTLVRGDTIHEMKINKKPALIIIITKILYEIGVYCSDRIITNSKDMANKLMRKFHIPLPHTIYNDIDTNKYYPIPKRKTYRSSLEISEGSFLVGYAGDLEPRKNVDTLIKAFSKPKIHKKWLVIAGRGKEKGRLMRMVEELSILSITTFVDWTDEVNKLLNCIDLLVLPSEYEGCPNIILEAMGAEISFLASDVRGTREIVPKSQRFTYRDDVELAKLIMLQHKTEIDFKSQVNNKKFIFNWEERVLNCCF